MPQADAAPRLGHAFERWARTGCIRLSLLFQLYLWRLQVY